METAQTAPAVDETRLNHFVGQILADLGGAYSASLVRLGDQLGLYCALHEQGPATAVELAGRTGCAERYLQEWLAHQAASNYLTYDPADGRFTLPPEQAMVFVDEASPVYMMGGFENVATTIENEPKVAEAFPRSTFVGFDFHPESIAAAKNTASARNAFDSRRPRHRISRASMTWSRSSTPCTTWATRPADGTWMIVEPMAADTLQENLNPVGRLFYAASTMICVPTALAQGTGTALGAQAGEKRLTEVIAGGGFTNVRRAAETPFNLVLEACAK